MAYTLLNTGVGRDLRKEKVSKNTGLYKMELNGILNTLDVHALEEGKKRNKGDGG